MTEVVMHDEAPTTTGIMGQPIPAPEFAGTACDDCGAYGYVSDTTFPDGEPRIVCADCADG